MYKLILIFSLITSFVFASEKPTINHMITEAIFQTYSEKCNLKDGKVSNMEELKCTTKIALEENEKILLRSQQVKILLEEQLIKIENEK